MATLGKCTCPDGKGGESPGKHTSRSTPSPTIRGTHLSRSNANSKKRTSEYLPPEGEFDNNSHPDGITGDHPTIKTPLVPVPTALPVGFVRLNTTTICRRACYMATDLCCSAPDGVAGDPPTKHSPRGSPISAIRGTPLPPVLAKHSKREIEYIPDENEINEVKNVKTNHNI